MKKLRMKAPKPKAHMGMPQKGGTFFGVPRTRTIVFGVYLGVPLSCLNSIVIRVETATFPCVFLHIRKP